MISDSETWERLNAYHDGELDRREAAEFRARLADDPVLQAALDEIGTLSAALKPLHPSAPARHAPKPDARRFSAGFIPAAAAAVAIIAGAFLFHGHDTARDPLDWHRIFASRTYLVQEFDAPTPVSQWIGNDLDLSSANLTLVDVQTLKGGDTYLHYSGINGCRLTVGAFVLPPLLPAASAKLHVQAWSVGPIYYSVLAEGMDRGKFAAIAHLLQNLTEQKRVNGDVVVTARKATQHAVPCV
jgi:hypothetical protein